MTAAASPPDGVALPFAACDHLPAIELALDALSAMRSEFAPRCERWFYGLACEVLADNYRLHRRLAELQAATTRWQQRDAVRLLAMELIDVVEGCGQMLRGLHPERLDELTDNPALREPLATQRDRFAGWRRVHERELRVLAKAIGVDAEAKERERLAFDADLDAVAVVGLITEMVVWLSSFGRATTLVISALRADKRRQASSN